MSENSAGLTDTTGVQRRRLLKGVGASGIGAAVLAGVGLGTTSRAARAATYSDNDILNFALNFEYLGAELYLHALTGTGLSEADTSGTGRKGTVSAGGPVKFVTPLVHSVVQKLAADELAHVRFLRKRLGSLAIAEPTINLSTVWTGIAISAGLIKPGETFNPYENEVSLLFAAYVLEDVCVTALAGSAAMLTAPADVTAAGGLLGTEAAQASAIRLILSILGQGKVTDAISALRAKLSDAPDDFGTTVPGDAFNFVSNDSNGLVFARTPAQVLTIAYSGGPAGKYGFFPDKVNGVIY